MNTKINLNKPLKGIDKVNFYNLNRMVDRIDRLTILTNIWTCLLCDPILRLNQVKQKTVRFISIKSLIS